LPPLSIDTSDEQHHLRWLGLAASAITLVAIVALAGAFPSLLVEMADIGPSTWLRRRALVPELGRYSSLDNLSLVRLLRQSNPDTRYTILTVFTLVASILSFLFLLHSVRSFAALRRLHLASSTDLVWLSTKGLPGL
jgi:hypothetical protein